MDQFELETLEQKTRSVVDTLEKLESEVEEYQKQNLDLRVAIDSLGDLAKGIAASSRDFLLIIELLRKSDLGVTLAELDKKIDKIETLYERVIEIEHRLEDKVDTINNGFEASSKILDQKLSASAKTIEALANTIGRIDRNTQKGIGKEKSN